MTEKYDGFLLFSALLVFILVISLVIYLGPGNSQESVCSHLQKKVGDTTINQPDVYNEMAIIGTNLHPNKVGLKEGKYQYSDDDNVYCMVNYEVCWDIQNKSICTSYYDSNLTINKGNYEAWKNE